MASLRTILHRQRITRVRMRHLTTNQPRPNIQAHARRPVTHMMISLSQPIQTHHRHPPPVTIMLMRLRVTPGQLTLRRPIRHIRAVHMTQTTHSITTRIIHMTTRTQETISQYRPIHNIMNRHTHTTQRTQPPCLLDFVSAYATSNSTELVTFDRSYRVRKSTIPTPKDESVLPDGTTESSSSFGQ